MHSMIKMGNHNNTHINTCKWRVMKCEANKLYRKIFRVTINLKLKIHFSHETEQLTTEYHYENVPNIRFQYVAKSQTKGCALGPLSWLHIQNWRPYIISPAEEPLNSRGRDSRMEQEQAHLLKWAGLNIWNKNPRTKKGPSSWGQYNTWDTLSPGGTNMEEELTASSPISAHVGIERHGLIFFLFFTRTIFKLQFGM
jgi:hypothetical protein